MTKSAAPHISPLHRTTQDPKVPASVELLADRPVPQLLRYRLEVATSDMRGAGTDSNVFVELHGMLVRGGVCVGGGGHLEAQKRMFCWAASLHGMQACSGVCACVVVVVV